MKKVSNFKVLKTIVSDNFYEALALIVGISIFMIICEFIGPYGLMLLSSSLCLFMFAMLVLVLICEFYEHFLRTKAQLEEENEKR
jgi:hypothetical protein